MEEELINVKRKVYNELDKLNVNIITSMEMKHTNTGIKFNAFVRYVSNDEYKVTDVIDDSFYSAELALFKLILEKLPNKSSHKIKTINSNENKINYLEKRLEIIEKKLESLKILLIQEIKNEN